MGGVPAFDGGQIKMAFLASSVQEPDDLFPASDFFQHRAVHVGSRPGRGGAFVHRPRFFDAFRQDGKGFVEAGGGIPGIAVWHVMVRFI